MSEVVFIICLAFVVLLLIAYNLIKLFINILAEIIYNLLKTNKKLSKSINDLGSMEIGDLDKMGLVTTEIDPDDEGFKTVINGEAIINIDTPTLEAWLCFYEKQNDFEKCNAIKKELEKREDEK